ncbi:ABC transporter ATP-binding protein [Actinomadura atramentaria]|uniref:ABC transporter ATP-binding protein n=1 Tax=Actinomadura atramentaria TaxID=1990 RepID=UPI003084594B
MREGEPAVAVDGLVKAFGEVTAVAGIDLRVGRGEIFGFLGPNGAGKSTTINMLCTLLRPSGGTARVAGFDVVAERDQVRRHIGLVFQDPTVDGYLSAEQNLRFHAELYGVPRARTADRIRQVLEMVALWTAAKTWCGRSRAGCAAAWRSRAACCTRRACCSWTSRPWAWTRRRARRSGTTSGG